ncbi:hotdog fold domain-containing protein [Actinokineospora pegani]|uniref:hotdog fold domain-containing protein n=1 Tax=Actinokineospora pegani TaxID=2654637 RepID=UPI0012EA7C17|nr:hotdog fold domain-containing protein [Actinokineospora pegani]
MPQTTPAATLTYRAWQRVSKLPLGPRLFSAAAVLRVPYFGTVLPTVEEMRPGLARVRAPKWWGVHNHIGTFHAIAVCNMAEIAMGMLAEATVPTTHRWIPAGMTVAYTAKATTSLTAVATAAVPDFGPTPFDHAVAVSVRDRADKEVATATITIRVSPTT